MKRKLQPVCIVLPFTLVPIRKLGKLKVLSGRIVNVQNKTRPVLVMQVAQALEVEAIEQ